MINDFYDIILHFRLWDKQNATGYFKTLHPNFSHHLFTHMSLKTRIQLFIL